MNHCPVLVVSYFNKYLYLNRYTDIRTNISSRPRLRDTISVVTGANEQRIKNEHYVRKEDPLCRTPHAYEVPPRNYNYSYSTNGVSEKEDSGVS